MKEIIDYRLFHAFWEVSGATLYRLEQGITVDQSVNFDRDRMVRLSADIRIAAIGAISDAGFGHIGGSMSMADVLAVLYGSIMRYRVDEPEWAERDYLVLSKGHSGPGLYAVLALSGFFPMEWLSTVNKPYTRLPSHADRQRTPGVDMTTGSLGQGISAACGIALGNRLRRYDSITYCIVGDGEMQEGQVWEAIQFASHQRLDKLMVLVDHNKKQLDGDVVSICDPLDYEAKFKAFGWDVTSVDGHDVQSIFDGIMSMKRLEGKPKAVVLHTEKGLGCCFAEEAAMNHYMVVNHQLAERAIREIELRLEAGTYPRAGAE